MWSLSVASTEDKWQYANVLIGSTTAYQLVFQSDQGKFGLIAIDDITLTSGCLSGGKSRVYNRCCHRRLWII